MSKYEAPTSRLICFGAKASTNAVVGSQIPEPGFDQLYDG